MSEIPNQRPPLRLAVLISGGGSTLGNLLARMANKQLQGIRIERVISSRADVRGLDIASAGGIPTAVVARKAYSDLETFSQALVESIGTPDLVVMGGFLALWKIPSDWTGRVLNIHPALLPDFGGQGMYGRHVHEAVLNAGARQSGCTVHLADDQYDHGPIVARSIVPVRSNDTPEALGERVIRRERELYPWVLQQVAVHGVEWLRQQADAGGVDYPLARV